MGQDGPLQGILLRLVEMWSKSFLVSPELVAIAGDAAVSPCNTFKPSCVAMKQRREILA